MSGSQSLTPQHVDFISSLLRLMLLHQVANSMQSPDRRTQDFTDLLQQIRPLDQGTDRGMEIKPDQEIDTKMEQVFTPDVYQGPNPYPEKDDVPDVRRAKVRTFK